MTCHDGTWQIIKVKCKGGVKKKKRNAQEENEEVKLPETTRWNKDKLLNLFVCVASHGCITKANCAAYNINIPNKQCCWRRHQALKSLFLLLIHSIAFCLSGVLITERCWLKYCLQSCCYLLLNQQSQWKQGQYWTKYQYCIISSCNNSINTRAPNIDIFLKQAGALIRFPGILS